MASPKFLNGIDLNKTEVKNIVIQNLASAPGSPVEGLCYFDTTLNQFGVYQNSVWVYLSAGSSTAITRASVASASGELIVAGDADRTAIAFTTNGLLKIAAGIVAQAVAGTDYVTGDSTNTFTNKTFNAAGTGNALSNLATSMFAANVIDTDVTLAADSDTRIASQKAVKAYVDALLNAQDAMVFKGAVDCSANPNYPAASAGHVYKVSVAGKIGGGSGVDVTAGDTLYCITDASAAGNHATVGANWVVVQANLDAASTTTQGIVELATQAEAEAKSDTVRAVTPVALLNFPIKKLFTIGDGATTALTCTHSLGTKDVQVQVRDASTDAVVYPDIVNTSTTITTITFAVAPTSNQYKVVIIG